MGCDKISALRSAIALQFQSTHPHGVRQTSRGLDFVELGFQSTHPHGVRRRNLFEISSLTKVSIHAPTWGATIIVTHTLMVFRFQSTHPHGVRLTSCIFTDTPCLCFNPRTHMGCDYLTHRLVKVITCFNPRTHMGCDLFRSIRKRYVRSFNPRTHMGCDLLRSKVLFDKLTFQSTHPHGVRHAPIPAILPTNCFNPRTHMGCDLHTHRSISTKASFNPRTHMGCDTK